MKASDGTTGVIGLGTGRCATTSLAEFLSMQRGVISSHWAMEYVRWQPTGRDVRKALAWWEKRMEEAAQAGAAFRADVSPWHLPYVERYLEAFDSVAVVALYREREATAKSWARALSSYRFLQKSDTSARRCFPTFAVDDAYTAALRYWDLYQAHVDRLIERYPNAVRRFDLEALNARQGQESILDWVGVGIEDPAARRYPKDCTFHTVV